MYRFIAAIAIVAMGCSSSEPGSAGQGTTIVDPDAIVLGLSHQDVSITVYKDNWWLIGSSAECKTLKGDMTDAEMADLKSYMGDAALQTLGKECSGDNYRVTIGPRPSACWSTDLKSPGIDGLIKFFADKVDKLATAPAGKCGANQTVEPTNWPKKDGAAGKGT